MTHWEPRDTSHNGRSIVPLTMPVRRRVRAPQNCRRRSSAGNSPAHCAADQFANRRHGSVVSSSKSALNDRCRQSCRAIDPRAEQRKYISQRDSSTSGPQAAARIGRPVRWSEPRRRPSRILTAEFDQRLADDVVAWRRLRRAMSYDLLIMIRSASTSTPRPTSSAPDAS